jgi:hypothetical protein
MKGAAEHWHTYNAKRLCAHYVRTGDEISFPELGESADTLDVVIARGSPERVSAFLVHLSADVATYEPGCFDERLRNCHRLVRMDEGTGGDVHEQQFDGHLAFDGYGVAVITTVPAEAG